MNPQDIHQMMDGTSIAPEIALWVFACLALLVEWWAPKRAERARPGLQLLSAEFMATLGLLIALLLVGFQASRFTGSGFRFSHMIVMDGITWYFKALCILTSLILMPSSWEYLRGRSNRTEFYALLLLATSGMTLMVESNDLINLFLSIEFLSITSYVLVGYLKGSRRSTEAAVKYFLFGSVCSALMLYGMSILYGITGSTQFDVIRNSISTSMASALPNSLFALAIVTFFAGIGFKISMWPFHMWAPDAYEGAPTPVTAFLSVGPKLAGIAVFIRVAETMFRTEPHWPFYLGISALVTMFWGNLAALGQQNVKRLLAYSSIAQAGYLLVGVVALSVAPAGGRITPMTDNLQMALQDYAGPAVLVYSAAYLIMNLGAFIVAIEVERATGTSDIDGFAGLRDRHSWLAWPMTIFLLGLSGIPLTVGFIGKLYLFGSVVAGGEFTHRTLLWGLAAAGVINSVISVFYYFKVLQPIWTRESTSDEIIAPTPAVQLLVMVLAALTLGLGIYGQGITGPARDYQSVYGGPVTQGGLHATPGEVTTSEGQ